MQNNMASLIANRLGGSVAGRVFEPGLSESQEAPRSKQSSSLGVQRKGGVNSKRAMKEALSVIHSIKGTKNHADSVSKGGSVNEQENAVTPPTVQTVVGNGEVVQSSIGKVINCKAASCRFWEGGKCTASQIQIGANIKCSTYDGI